MGASENRQRTQLVAVRFLPDEHRALVQAAAAREISVGALIRSCLRAELTNDQETHDGA